MKEIVDTSSWRAALHYGDSATAEFYQRLALGSFATTRCRSCHQTSFPPRPFCPVCQREEVEWIELPHRAKLYAFTQQRRALRFPTPDVIGLVEIEGLGTILSKINAPFEELHIGLDLVLDPIRVSDELTIHAWKPAEDGA